MTTGLGYLHKEALSYEPFNPIFYTDEWQKDNNKQYNNFWVINPIRSKLPSHVIGNQEDWHPISELEICPRCGVSLIIGFKTYLTLAIEKNRRNYYCNRCGYSYPNEQYLKPFKKFMTLGVEQ